MNTNPVVTRRIRRRGLAGAAFCIALIRAPLFAAPDPLAFLPVKEAQTARQALSALDVSLTAWTAAWADFAAQAQSARGAAATQGDAVALKALLESGASGAWKTSRGLSLASARAGTLKAAARLAASLEPRIDKADEASLAGLISALRERASAIPEIAPEYLAFAERLSNADPASRRLALRALLEFEPDKIALRLASDGTNPASLPYGSDPELRVGGDAVRNLRGAMEALGAVGPALAVPELPWNPEEALRVEEVARRLSVVDPALRGQVLDAYLGVNLLPAFLSGLSPEEVREWRLDRKLSPRAVRIFLSGSNGSGPAKTRTDAERRSGDSDLLRALTELERDRAQGLAGLSFLARMSDPALRNALRASTAPGTLRDAYAESTAALTAALETLLFETAPAGNPAPGSEGRYRVKADDLPGAGGFTLIRAFFEPKEGELVPVPAETVDQALRRAAAGADSEKAAEEIFQPPEWGLLVPGESEKTPSALLRDLGPKGESIPVFAALNALWSARLRTEARDAGLAAVCLLPPRLADLEDASLRRCRGNDSDKAFARVLAEAGGPAQAARLWDAAFRNLEFARRALAVYTETGAVP